MTNASLQNTPAWKAPAGKKFPPLQADAEADACIVGAGITGLSVAYFLAKEGKSVIVLDDGPIGGGESGRTTAHFVTALDDRYFEIIRMHGEENARLIAESHATAIDAVENIVQKENIDCAFSRVPGYLVLSSGEPTSMLEEELEATHACGLKDIQLLEKSPFSFTDTGPALLFPNQGQLEILLYLHGLAGAIEKNGGSIFTGTHAAKVHGGKDAYVETDDGNKVRASSIVVATNSPVNDRVTMHTKQAAYRTYVLGFSIPKGSVPPMLLWDSGKRSESSPPVAYHYVRIQEGKDQDLLIVGGEDHKTGQADDAGRRFARLEQWTQKHFPMAEEITHRWSGQVLEPADGLAFIGRNPLDADNVYIATGDSGNGMTHGTIAGLLICDLILGKKNRWEEIYGPSRKPPLKALKTFASENLNVAGKYCELVTPGEHVEPKDIPNEHGVVVRDGVRKIALYRDEKGSLHKFSAICKHLGCAVHWNSFEKSWDCPCHGARYAAMGEVINGPANEGLKRVR